MKIEFYYAPIERVIIIYPAIGFHFSINKTFIAKNEINIQLYVFKWHMGIRFFWPNKSFKPFGTQRIFKEPIEGKPS